MARPKNFKQFKKQEKLKDRSSLKRKISNAAGLGRRRSNRRDHDDKYHSTASMEDLVQAVSTGTVNVSTDSLDSRALTDLLLSSKPRAATKDKSTSDPTTTTAKSTKHQFALSQVPASEVPSFSVPADSLLPKISAEEEEEDGYGKKDRDTKNKYEKVGKPYSFWKQNGVHPSIISALRDTNFSHPTPIQSDALPAALQDTLSKDIVVSSETGSGKTMVFALPVLCSILRGHNSFTNPVGVRGGKAAKKRAREEEEKKEEDVEGVDAETLPNAEENTDLPKILHALIVTPTRELAQQIAICFKGLCTHIKKHEAIRIGCIVGGMAQHKQQRELNVHPQVLICTPGRVWDLLVKNEGCFLGHSMSRRLSFVVLDEADRLLQSGRFEHLRLLLDRIHSEMLPTSRSAMDTTVVHAEGSDAEPEEIGGPVQFNPETGEYEPVKAPAREGEEGGPRVKDRPIPMRMPPPPHRKHRVITIITSATLSLEVNYQKRDVKGKRTILRTENANMMGQVVAACIRTSDFLKFEQKPETGVVANLHETYLRCPEKAKDLYLYYFLRRYRERTIIFVNAISMLRRLTKLLEILGVPCSALHASMQQRQRLAYIDKFKSGERRVLVATDVAARGLDVEGVKYVVHYQLPRSTDGYIHRCGRTARCGGTGFSLVLVEAKEYAAFQKLLESMNRSTPLEVFALEPMIIHHLAPHMQLALQIDKLSLEIGKQTAQQRWVKQNADAGDLDADDLIKSNHAEDVKQKTKVMNILKKRLLTMSMRDLDIGHKGSFRSAPKALGASNASEKLRDRADRQVYKSD